MQLLCNLYNIEIAYLKENYINFRLEKLKVKNIKHWVQYLFVVYPI